MKERERKLAITLKVNKNEVDEEMRKKKKMIK